MAVNESNRVDSIFDPLVSNSFLDLIIGQVGAEVPELVVWEM
jgi:hypothetical protein